MSSLRSVAGMSGLRFLNLAHNEIKTLEFIQGCVELRALLLNNNKCKHLLVLILHCYIFWSEHARKIPFRRNSNGVRYCSTTIHVSMSEGPLEPDTVKDRERRFEHVDALLLFDRNF